MSNEVFNVKGSTEEELKKTLELVFLISRKKVRAWELDLKKGLILYSYADQKNVDNINGKINLLPYYMESEETFYFVNGFLQSEESKNIVLQDTDEEYLDDDYFSIKGWRVYTEDWGMVDGRDFGFVAITPSYFNYGK